MSKANHSEIRFNFLYNLPGLLYYLDLKLWLEIKSNYLSLLQDSVKEVRSQALLVFHQVVQLCGKDFTEYPEVCYKLLDEILLTKDNNVQKELITEVFTGLLDHVDLLVGGIYRQLLQLEEKEETGEHFTVLLSKMCSTLIKILETAHSLSKHQMVQKLHKKMLACCPYFSPEQLLK